MNTLSAKSRVKTTVMVSASPKASREPEPSAQIEVELWLELVSDPLKYCPAFAYANRDNPPELQRIVAVLNRTLWPTSEALERSDFQAIRWLVAGAVLDRCLTWGSHPILRAVSRYLAHAALGDGWQDYQRGIWTAYSLRNDPLFATIDCLSILKEKLEGRPEKFASFTVEVDSIRLADWRAKIRETRYVTPPRFSWSFWNGSERASRFP